MSGLIKTLSNPLSTIPSTLLKRVEDLEPHTIQSGWLKKRDSNVVTGAKWRKQWFVITPGFLYRFDDPKSQTCKEIIPLSGGAAWDATGRFLSNHGIFAVGHASHQTHFLTAKTSDENNEWLSILQESMVLMHENVDHNLAMINEEWTIDCMSHVDQDRIAEIETWVEHNFAPDDHEAAKLIRLAMKHPNLHPVGEHEADTDDDDDDDDWKSDPQTRMCGGLPSTRSFGIASSQLLYMISALVCALLFSSALDHFVDAFELDEVFTIFFQMALLVISVPMVVVVLRALIHHGFEAYMYEYVAEMCGHYLGFRWRRVITLLHDSYTAEYEQATEVGCNNKAHSFYGLSSNHTFWDVGGLQTLVQGPPLGVCGFEHTVIKKFDPEAYWRTFLEHLLTVTIAVSITFVPAAIYDLYIAGEEGQEEEEQNEEEEEEEENPAGDTSTTATLGKSHPSQEASAKDQKGDEQQAQDEEKEKYVDVIEDVMADSVGVCIGFFGANLLWFIIAGASVALNNWGSPESEYNMSPNGIAVLSAAFFVHEAVHAIERYYHFLHHSRQWFTGWFFKPLPGLHLSVMGYTLGFLKVLVLKYCCISFFSGTSLHHMYVQIDPMLVVSMEDDDPSFATVFNPPGFGLPGQFWICVIAGAAGWVYQAHKTEVQYRHRMHHEMLTSTTDLVEMNVTYLHAIAAIAAETRVRAFHTQTVVLALSVAISIFWEEFVKGLASAASPKEAGQWERFGMMLLFTFIITVFNIAMYRWIRQKNAEEVKECIDDSMKQFEEHTQAMESSEAVAGTPADGDLADSDGVNARDQISQVGVASVTTVDPKGQPNAADAAGVGGAMVEMEEVCCVESNSTDIVIAPQEEASGSEDVVPVTEERDAPGDGNVTGGGTARKLVGIQGAKVDPDLTKHVIQHLIDSVESIGGRKKEKDMEARRAEAIRLLAQLGVIRNWPEMEEETMGMDPLPVVTVTTGQPRTYACGWL